MDSIFECAGLTKFYKNFPALNNVNIKIAPGRIVGLLGPNGSGKTTLIKMINGLLTPTSGSLFVNGMKIGAKTKNIVSYLPDNNFLNPQFSTEEMINYFESFFEDFSRQTAEKMLCDLKIDCFKKIKTLSKGTQEKVALILVMSRKAKLYLLDEPIAGVDPATRDYIMRTILSAYDRSSSIIISTHLISDIEKILDDVIFINNGNIMLSDSVENIKASGKESVDEYFREVFRC